jgi:hypothetical protein
MINGKQKIKTDEWKTPGWLFNQLNARFNFTIDAAAHHWACKVYQEKIINGKVVNWPNFFADGLEASWKNHRVWCNPPFSDKKTWIKKAHDEVLSDCPLCVMPLPNCIDTIYFNKYIDKKFHWEHLPYRVSFLDENNKPISGNPSGTILVYYWDKIVR